MNGHAVAVIALLGVAACSDATGAGTKALSVSAVSPAPNAVAVPRSDTVHTWVSLPVDSASCASRFTLHLADSLGAGVPGHVMLGSGGREMMFVPDAPMQPGTSYFAHVRDSVLAPGGMMGGSGMMLMTGSMPAGTVRMGSGTGWAFTTGQ